MLKEIDQVIKNKHRDAAKAAEEDSAEENAS